MTEQVDWAALDRIWEGRNGRRLDSHWQVQIATKYPAIRAEVTALRERADEGDEAARLHEDWCGFRERAEAAEQRVRELEPYFARASGLMESVKAGDGTEMLWTLISDMALEASRER